MAYDKIQFRAVKTYGHEKYKDRPDYGKWTHDKTVAVYDADLMVDDDLDKEFGNRVRIEARDVNGDPVRLAENSTSD